MNPTPVRVFPLQQAIISRRVVNSPAQLISDNALQRQGHLLVDRYSRPTSNSIDIRRRSRSSNVLRKQGQQQQQQCMSLDQQSSFLNGSNNLSGTSINNNNNNNISSYSSNTNIGTKKGNTVDSVVQNYINNKTTHNSSNTNALDSLQSAVHNYSGLSQLKPSSSSHKRTQSNAVVQNSQQYAQHSGIVATMLQQMQNNQSSFIPRNNSSNMGSNIIPTRPSQSMLLAQAASSSPPQPPPPNRYSTIASRNVKSKAYEGIISRLESKKDNNDKLPKVEAIIETSQQQQQQFQLNSPFVPSSAGRNLNSVSLQANSLNNLNNNHNNQPKQYQLQQQQQSTQSIKSRFFDGKTDELLLKTPLDKKSSSFLRINRNNSSKSSDQFAQPPLINTFMDTTNNNVPAATAVQVSQQQQPVDMLGKYANPYGKSTNNFFSEKQQQQQKQSDNSKSKSIDIDRKNSKKTIVSHSTGASRPATQSTTTLQEYSIANLINIPKNDNNNNSTQTNTIAPNNHLKLAKNNNYIIPPKSQINTNNHSHMWNNHSSSNNYSSAISSINYSISPRTSFPFSNIAVQTQPGALPGKPIKTNQDSYIIETSISGDNSKSLLSVCDGHGANGHFASQYVKKVLCNNIMTFLNSNTQTIKQSLISGFLRTAAGLLSSGIDVMFSGSTCVAVYITHQNYWCANLGDSRAIIIRENTLNARNSFTPSSSSPFSTTTSTTTGNQRNNSISRSTWTCQALSIDHKPDLPSEKQRILRCNGRVDSYKDNENRNPVGPARVWLKNENIPGLAMSRSFGDYIASTVGVISEPEVLQFDVSQEDRILVVASDGVWEFLSNKQVMEMIKPFYASNDCQAACEKVVKEATAAWKREDDVIDDITVIIAFLNRN